MDKVVKIEIEANLENQGLARAFVSTYVANLDPMVDELTEIKTAVSEAVANAVVHGYKNNGKGKVVLTLGMLENRRVSITITDSGVGIENIDKAREPLYSTESGGEYSGMGFTIMESFMDRVAVKSSPGEGTTVTLIKQLDATYEQ